MALKWMELLPYVYDVVLRQDTRNCLLASLSFDNCLQGFMQLSEEYQVDERVYFGTVSDYKSTVMIRQAKNGLNFLQLCTDGPLGHGFKFC